MTSLIGVIFILISVACAFFCGAGIGIVGVFKKIHDENRPWELTLAAGEALGKISILFPASLISLVIGIIILI